MSEAKSTAFKFSGRKMIALEEDEQAGQNAIAALEEIAARLGVRAERGRRFAELTSLRVGGAIDWVIVSGN